MTLEEARQIEQAAIILLRTVLQQQLASPDVIAALRTLISDRELEISLRTARELLEATSAWRETR
jgi:hypothetical protein